MRGRPFTLRCSICKRGENHTMPRTSHSNLVRLGPWGRAAIKGYRHNVLVILVAHSCGHAFWTDNRAARSLPLDATARVTTRGAKPRMNEEHASGEPKLDPWE